MTGAGATVVRASVMAILAIIARTTGRKEDIGRVLVVTAMLMCAWNPWTLVYDVSFQLSFIATIGLIFVTPKVEPWFFKLSEKFGIRSIVSATVATTITTLPFLLYKMGILSVVSLPVNLLVLPFVPSAMLFGFIAVMLGSISIVLALPVALLARFILGYILFLITGVAGFPFAKVVVPAFPFWMLLLLYFILWWYFWGRKILTKLNKYDTIKKTPNSSI
jgi:competence protein ComEC